MYTSVRKLLNEGKMSKWVKVTDEEIQCVIDSIPGENMVRNAPHNRMDGSTSGDNLRHHVDRGYICITSTFSAEAEKHPLDIEQADPSVTATGIGESNVSVRSEPGVFVAT